MGSHNGSAATPAEVAQWLHRHEEADGFLPDAIPPGISPPLDTTELTVLFDLARRIPAVDRAAAMGILPAEGSLPAGEVVVHFPREHYVVTRAA